MHGRLSASCVRWWIAKSVENKNEKRRKKERGEKKRRREEGRYVGGKSEERRRRRRSVKESIGEEKRGHGAVGQ